MKRTKSMRYNPSENSRELLLCTVNETEMNEVVQAIKGSLHKKYMKGIYDQDKAIDAWYHVATIEAKLYSEHFGYWFTVEERFTAAVDLEDYFREDIMVIDN